MNIEGSDLTIVAAALDLFSRAEMGRPDQVMDLIIMSGRRFDGRGLTPDETCRARELLEEAAAVITGVKHGGPGINNPIVPERARQARKLLHEIVHG